MAPDPGKEYVVSCALRSAVPDTIHERGGAAVPPTKHVLQMLRLKNRGAVEPRPVKERGVPYENL